jgi:hypothetical protein
MPSDEMTAAIAPPSGLVSTRYTGNRARLTSQRPSEHPTLLPLSESAGTLAAARSLDHHGIRVVVASPSMLATPRWSRSVARWARSPAPRESRLFLEWLSAFGERKPGHVLCATSSELALLIAEHRPALERSFRLSTATRESVLSVLDAAERAGVCRRLGIAHLAPAAPTDELADSYVLAGYVGRIGQGAAMRAASRLQAPTRLRLGTCLEAAELDAQAFDAVVHLCHETGYFGVFRATFARRGRSLVFADFQPCLYPEVGFEIARQLPLPYLVWLAALGEDAAVTQLLSEGGAWQEKPRSVYCDGLAFQVGLSVRHLFGRAEDAEAEHWKAWLHGGSERRPAVDPTRAPGDRLPGAAAAATEVVRLALGRASARLASGS